GLSRDRTRDLQLRAAMRAPHHARGFGELFHPGADADRRPPSGDSAGGAAALILVLGPAIALAQPPIGLVSSGSTRRPELSSTAATIRQRPFAIVQQDASYRFGSVSPCRPRRSEFMSRSA